MSQSVRGQSWNRDFHLHNTSAHALHPRSVPKGTKGSLPCTGAESTPPPHSCFPSRREEFALGDAISSLGQGKRVGTRRPLPAPPTRGEVPLRGRGCAKPGAVLCHTSGPNGILAPNIRPSFKVGAQRCGAGGLLPSLPPPPPSSPSSAPSFRGQECGREAGMESTRGQPTAKDGQPPHRPAAALPQLQ